MQPSKTSDRTNHSSSTYLTHHRTLSNQNAPTNEGEKEEGESTHSPGQPDPSNLLPTDSQPEHPPNPPPSIVSRHHLAVPTSFASRHSSSGGINLPSIQIPSNPYAGYPLPAFTHPGVASPYDQSRSAGLYPPPNETLYDLRGSSSKGTGSSPLNLSPYSAAGFPYPLDPSLELDDRAIRSPHPPLTATFPRGHQASIWTYPYPPSASSSHFAAPLGNGIESERGFHSSPLVPDYPPLSGLSHCQVASSSHHPAYPHIPPNSTTLVSQKRRRTDYRASPVRIPPPLKFNFSSSPPPPLQTAPLEPFVTMPPRKKAGVASSSGRPTPANSHTVSSSTSSRRKTGPKGNGWTMEQTYDSQGKAKDVIVIDDSESPNHPRKRTRAQAAAASAGLNGYSMNGSTSSLGAAVKKRKADEVSEAGGSKKPKGKASGTAGSTYAVHGALQPRQNVPAAPATATATPWDDQDGHYIIRPDDVIANKYKIIRLLGQGTFGKVVEARHIETRRKVAIKVIRAVQKYRDASKIEIRVLEALKRNDPQNQNNCIHLLEYFDYRNHPCLVSELYGMSVFDFLKQNSFSPFPERHIQDFARSLLKSVAFLHKLRLVHTDLKPENILLVSNESSLSGPRQVKNSKAKSILRDTDIRLIDFGSATFENEYHSSVVSTRHYRAPEIILGMSWSYPCDLFSIGCILVEFYTGEALFQTHDNLEHLAMMEVVMGQMPARLVEKGRLKRPEFFKNGRVDFPNANVSRSSKKFVKSLRSLRDIIPPTNSHNKLFLDLIVRLLDFDPDNRITVAQALKHPYCNLHIEEPS